MFKMKITKGYVCIPFQIQEAVAFNIKQTLRLLPGRVPIPFSHSRADSMSKSPPCERSTPSAASPSVGNFTSLDSLLFTSLVKLL